MFLSFFAFMFRMVVRCVGMASPGEKSNLECVLVPGCNISHLEVGRVGLEVLPCWASGGLWEWLPCVGVEGVEFIVNRGFSGKAFQPVQTNSHASHLIL